MSDLTEPIICEIYPLKKGWKILRDGVRIGLASNRDTAINKIMRLSANLGVLYRVRIYKEDGSLETETSCFSPRSSSEEIDIRPRAFSETDDEDSTQVPDTANVTFSGEQLDAGTSMQERIALLAYSYWERRGRQGGSPEDDWYRAEQEILEQL